jgi:MarR family transcriptional regulator, organic hydroperoxide resistance regulator
MPGRPPGVTSTQPLDRRLLFLMHRAHRAMMGHVNARMLDELGISASQLTTLLYVAKNRRCSMSDVAAVLDLAKSAASSTLHRLEVAGFLRREPNPKDARGSLLVITASGEETRVRSLPLLRRLQEQLTEGFDVGERETILRFLNSLVDRYGDAAEDDD